MIKPCKKKDLDSRPLSEQKWCLYNSVGTKLLGRHPSKESALKQERAIQIHKHGRAEMKKTAAYSAEDLKKVTMQLQQMVSTLPDKSRKNVLNYINNALSKASWESSLKPNKPISIRELLPQKAEGYVRAKRIARIIANYEVERTADHWEDLPKGWDKGSAEKYWKSLTGDATHKVSKCIKMLEGKVEDPGAFCASLRDRLETRAWRSERRKRD